MPPSSSTCVKCDPALAFYVAALTGRWVGGRVGYPGCCPGLGVAGLSARCLHVRPEEATAISPGTMFVQMRAESSSLELCRMQPNFASLMQRTGALAEGRHPGEACPHIFVRPVRAATYHSVFYSTALTGRWGVGCLLIPGRCPGLGVAGPSARLPP